MTVPSDSDDDWEAGADEDEDAGEASQHQWI